MTTKGDDVAASVSSLAENAKGIVSPSSSSLKSRVGPIPSIDCVDVDVLTEKRLIPSSGQHFPHLYNNYVMTSKPAVINSFGDTPNDRIRNHLVSGKYTEYGVRGEPVRLTDFAPLYPPHVPQMARVMMRVHSGLGMMWVVAG